MYPATFGIKKSYMVWIVSSVAHYSRAVGYEALGFSYMPKTPVLLHDHNEFLHEDVFLKGIDVFEEVVQRMANVDWLKESGGPPVEKKTLGKKGQKTLIYWWFTM